MFKTLVMKEIFIAANKDKSKIVTEIDVLKFEHHGTAPTVHRLEKQPCEKDEVSIALSSFYNLVLV